MNWTLATATAALLLILGGRQTSLGDAGDAAGKALPPNDSKPATGVEVASGEPSAETEQDPAWLKLAKAKGAQNAIPPIVVRFSVGENDDVSALEEDLAVMGKIIDRSLERAFGKETPDVRMGIPMVLSSGGRSVRAMYTEGFGALFTLKVNFPLMAPRVATDTKPESGESDWDRAKEELYNQAEDNWISEEGALPAIEYDPARVEALKRDLLISLKNASNIRGLKPNEFLTVTAFGTPSLAQSHSSKWVNGTGAGIGSNNREGSSAGVRGRLSSDGHRGTVLAIRVKKADIDAFAKASGKLAELQSKATINTYRGYGYGVPSVNSWVKQGKVQSR